MGTTLAHVVAAAGRRATLWCRDPETARAIARDGRHPARPGHALSPALVATASLEEAVRGAPLVLVAVHSTEFAATARRLAPLVDGGQALLSATKGIELPSLRRMSDVLREEAGAGTVGAITGLNITPEIMAGQLSALLVASPSAEARALAARMLATPRLLVETTGDLRSAELASVLKNVAAIAVGIATGLEMGFNARGMVFARGLAEVESLGTALGAAPAAFHGIGGTGDLFLTAASPQSLNRRLGIELGQGRTLEEIVAALPEVPEGIGAVRACRLLADRAGMRLPLCRATAEIMDGEARTDALERALVHMREGAGE
jgi:glycerol-3-phosphate dehydrogenase (NAD(P)+)